MAIRFAQTNGYVLGWNWKEASEILRRNIRLPGEMSKEEKSFFSSRDFAEGYSQNLLKFGSNLIQNHNYSLAYSATGNIDTADGLTLDLFFIGKGLFFRRGSSSFRGVAVADESTTVLKGTVKINFTRFVKKIPANSKSSASFKQLKNGNYLFEATSPGRVPGSKAVYQKWVNPQGTTFKMLKTTFGPDGKIIHIKSKM